MSTTTTEDTIRTIITEEAVVAFFKSAARDLARQTGVDYSSVRFDYNNNGDMAWGAYCDGGTHTTGKTLDEAIAAELVAMGPKARAKRIRDNAAQLLREAEILEAQA